MQVDDIQASCSRRTIGVLMARLARDWGTEFLRSVTDALEADGIPTVLPDSYGGMYQKISHLVEIHGYRQIAFLRGPVGQVEAEQRYQAYRDVLALHHIPLNSCLVLGGDFKAENLFQEARLSVGEIALRDQAYRRLLADWQESAVQQFDYAMAVLSELAPQGDVFTIRELSVELTKQDSKYAPFSNKLGRLARGFETVRILNFIKHFVENPT